MEVEAIRSHSLNNQEFWDILASIKESTKHIPYDFYFLLKYDEIEWTCIGSY